MQALIEQLTSNFGVNEKQATGIFLTVKEYTEEKCPEYGNTLDSIFNCSSNVPGEMTKADSEIIWY